MTSSSGFQYRYPSDYAGVIDLVDSDDEIMNSVAAHVPNHINAEMRRITEARRNGGKR